MMIWWPLFSDSAAEMLEPPSYSVAVTLPTYDESLRSKQEEEEEQQHLCESASSSSEVVTLDIVKRDVAIVVCQSLCSLENSSLMLCSECLSHYYRNSVQVVFYALESSATNLIATLNPRGNCQFLSWVCTVHRVIRRWRIYGSRELLCSFVIVMSTVFTIDAVCFWNFFSCSSQALELIAPTSLCTNSQKHVWKLHLRIHFYCLPPW